MSAVRHRRLLISAAGATLAMPALLLHRAHAQGARRATPGQTEGPFYPVRIPDDSDADLLRNGARSYAQGEPAWVEGTLTDLDGKPLVGASVEIWQADHSGRYHHPGDGDRADPAFQGFGRIATDTQGRWRFRTIKPVPYSGRAPHIHVKVKQGARELLTTQLYVAGAPGNERDGLWRRLRNDEERDALTRAFTAGSDGVLKASFPIVVAA